MGLSTASLDTPLDCNAPFNTNIYDWQASSLDLNASLDWNVDYISESSTSPCFGGLPLLDETLSSYSAEDWTSNTPEPWPDNFRPRNHVCQYQSSSHRDDFDDFAGLQDLENFSNPQIRYPNFSKSRQYDCDWLGCSKAGSLSNVEDWKLHMKDHGRTARGSWKPSEPCGWQGCSSKARFKTAKIFEDHLNNIHINPLLCTFEGCRHRTPFRGKADLQRHINSVHTEGTKSKCPFLSCRAERRYFSRKDKLILHLRAVHDTEPCPFAHCDVALDPRKDSTAKHIAKLHGELECALGSCKQFASSFCDNGLLEHLQLDHKMRWETVLKARDMAKNLGNNTVKDEHILGAEADSCNICRSKQVYKVVQ